MNQPVTPTGEVHPAADVFPMIEGDELEALVDSIREHGLTEAIWLTPDGVLLDGRNRLAACKNAGVAPSFRVYEGDDLVDFIVRLNIHRRHLSTGQKNAAGYKLTPLYQAEAEKRVGGRPKKAAKPSPDLDQVSATEKATEKSSDPKRNKTTTKAANAVGASATGVAQFKRVAEAAPDLAKAIERNQISTDLGEKLLKLRLKYPDHAEPFVQQVIAGDIDLKSAQSECRKTKAKADYLARQAEWDATANKAGDTWTMRHGDFRDILAELEPGSVDAIITDPPYPDEFLDLWGDLAEIAAKILRPGAPLIAWSGQYRLQKVLNHLCGPLTYQWTLCLDLPGSNARFRGPNFIQTWKPIIVATNGTWGPHDWFRDRVTSPHKDQDVYEWQQNPEPAAELITRYVPEGGLVVDPFTGVGSFGAAALATRRRFLGVEIDEGRYIESRQRFTGAAE